MQRIRKKALFGLLVFLYVFGGIVGHHSYTWCSEENGASHLEYNITGTCQIAHQSGCNAEKGAPPPSASLADAAINCLDVPLSSIQGRSQDPASFDKTLSFSSSVGMVFILKTSERPMRIWRLISKPSPSVFDLKSLGTVALLI